MSEYQYYEFQALGRTLTAQERAKIGELSSRAHITATRAVFTYSYSDLRADPIELLANYFDIMYYVANWGNQRLAFRFPQGVIPETIVAPYCLDDCICFLSHGQWDILDWNFGYEEDFGWIEGEGQLSELLPLRQELLQQDYRSLYLAWLRGITSSEEYMTIGDPHRLEPPIPPGLNQLTPAQSAFVNLFALDPYLLTLASRPSLPLTPASTTAYEDAISQLSRPECDRFLLKLLQGESNLSAQLRQRLAELSQLTPPASPPQRAIAELWEEAEQARTLAEEQEKQARQAQKIAELQALAPQEPQLWQKVDDLLVETKPKNYEEAIALLLKLRELAAYRDQIAPFQARIQQIAQRYQRRSGLINRLHQAQLLPKSAP